MKKFLLSLILLLSSCGGGQAAQYFPATLYQSGGVYGPATVPFSNANIVPLGRVNTQSDGYWSGFGGSRYAFTITGASSVTINTNQYGDGTDGQCDQWSIDSTTNFDWYETYPGSTSTCNLVYPSGGPTAHSFTISLPDTGTHTVRVFLDFGSTYNSQFEVTTKQVFTGVAIPSGSVLTAPSEGTYWLQAVGDSWFSTRLDYAQVMNQAKWKVFAPGSGGIPCSTSLAIYPYQYGTTPVTGDPPAHVILDQFGVNDYHDSVSTSSYASCVNSLISLQNTAQPGVPIFVIVEPDNTNLYPSDGKWGSTYESTIESIVTIQQGAGNKVYLCDAQSLNSSLASAGWTPNSSGDHFSNSGATAMASFIDSCITSNGY